MAHEETIEDLEAGLQIDEHALNDAEAAQPDLFYRVARRVALLTSQRDEAKQLVSEEEAHADRSIREAAVQEDRKMSEKQIESEKLLDVGVVKARENLSALQRELGIVNALKEAYIQRSHALKDLANLYVAGYFGQSITARADISVRNVVGGRVKEALANERQRVRRER